MAQIKVYGIKEHLKPIQRELSSIIHGCVVDAFLYPADKRFHRFIHLEREDFLYPEDRSDKYTIIEISIFEGRTVESKKKLIAMLFERVEGELHIKPDDIEITIIETPKCNWGIRGLPGDELQLNYKVDV
ncbi:tautomerase family protein [Paenibacillus sp. YPG26]|uniref:tautomerase family protein n=1 Tax=Paenibacillus sp. YPG26 TaxID=2878915 RepID=UPI00203DDD9D|nr:tautomerase family protein [Paenibacillus sp. YPG26]USB32990.1 tautomerase family protein [Paenibacillus sp. YPG26]